MERQIKLLIDGDGILYRAGFAVEKTKYLVEKEDTFIPCDSAAETKQIEGGIVWSRKEIEPLENALFLADTIMDKILGKYPGASYQLWLTPSMGNFREQIAKTHKYKGNRDVQPRPKYYKDIAKHLVDKHGAVYSDGQEADDELGIGASVYGSDAVLVSYDKDLRQIPGKHYNWVEEIEFDVSKKEGLISFYSQILSGDATDNIYGLYGIGPAKASKMLANCTSGRDCWKIVLDAYRDKESEDRAIENARLLWVRRKPNEIWEPPT